MLISISVILYQFASQLVIIYGACKIIGKWYTLSGELVFFCFRQFHILYCSHISMECCHTATGYNGFLSFNGVIRLSGVASLTIYSAMQISNH